MKMKPKISFFLVPLALFSAGFLFAFLYFFPDKDMASTDETPVVQEESDDINKQETKDTQVSIKESTLLNVPYTVQAPFASWNINEESCEEASVMMYKYFLDNQTTFDGASVIPQQNVMDDLAKMKRWQVQNYGKEPDLTVQELLEFSRAYYKVEGKIIKATKEEIMKELSAGNPVIVPATTASLGNPYYPPNTDTYHFFIIKGYRGDGIITNDPGTKRGESYFYTWDRLFGALQASLVYVNQDLTGLVLTK